MFFPFKRVFVFKFYPIFTSALNPKLAFVLGSLDISLSQLWRVMINWSLDIAHITFVSHHFLAKSISTYQKTKR